MEPRGCNRWQRGDALDAMEGAYAAAGVKRFAAWMHENDRHLRTDLERRGYSLQETTRAMGMELDDMRMPRPELELGATDWDDYLRIFGLPPGLLSGADHTAFHVLVARVDGERVATAMAFDHHGDCGIYKVATLEHAWRRGLGTALTAIHPAQCTRARVSDGKRAVNGDSRRRLRLRRLPRSRPDPRIRAVDHSAARHPRRTA
jgi:Acetyltransferase (GNAT) family